MDSKEIIMKIAEFLEKTGIKNALKSPEVVETIYNAMSKHGMTIDKNIFSLVVLGFANAPMDKLGDLIGTFSSVMSQSSQNAQGGAEANPLTAILGAVAQGTAQPQTQAPAQGAEANPLAALGALGALAGALGGAAQQGQAGQTQTQTPPNAADLLGGLAKAFTQNQK